MSVILRMKMTRKYSNGLEEKDLIFKRKFSFDTVELMDDKLLSFKRARTEDTEKIYHLSSNDSVKSDFTETFIEEEGSQENIPSKHSLKKCVCFCLDEDSSSTISSGTNSKFLSDCSFDQPKGDLKITELMKASRDNDIEYAKQLIEKGADPTRKDSRGFDALMYSVRDGHAEMSELILIAIRKKVSKEGQKGYTFRNKYRFTHMMYAALNGHTDCINVLVRHGCRTDIKDSQGFSPLMAAALNNHADTVATLLRLGCSVNQRNNKGLNALFYGVYSKSIEIVNMLIQYGADVNVKDLNNRTPLLFAIMNGANAIGELLLQHNAVVCNMVRKAVLSSHLLSTHSNRTQNINKVGKSVGYKKHIVVN